MMNFKVIATVLLMSAALVGCSSDDTGSSTSPTSGGGTTSKPSAPKLDKATPMSGALHVQWTNPSTKCDAIEVERKMEGTDGSVHEEYKVVFTVPGSADNKHDTGATMDMKFTYRLRCKVGSAYSEYSNETSANPTE